MIVVDLEWVIKEVRAVTSLVLKEMKEAAMRVTKEGIPKEYPHEWKALCVNENRCWSAVR